MFPTAVLARVEKLTQDPMDRAHVSCFIYHNPYLFRINGHGLAANAETCAPDIRVALDTPSDYELITKIFDELYPLDPQFKAKDVVKFLRNNPELLLINSHVRAKAIEEG